MDTKACSKCGRVLPLSAFSKCSQHKSGYKSRCKECSKEDSKLYYKAHKVEIIHRTTQWYQEHRTEYNAYRRTYDPWKSRKKLYGIDKETLHKMYEEQDHKCAICGRTLTLCGKGGDAVHVDHDHKTGKVRKLLCQRCNMALGLFSDNPDLLKKASEYITK